MIPRISLLLKQSEASMSDWKLFLHENTHKTVKNPDTGRDVKLQSLKGPKGKELLQKMFEDWKKGREKTDESSPVEGNVYAKLNVTYNGNHSGMDRLNETVGSNLTVDHLYDMMGLDHFMRTNPNESHYVTISFGYNQVHVEYKGPHVQYMERKFLSDNQSKLIIYNEILRLREDAPQGLGTKLLAHQVSQALKHNVSKIKCEAAGCKDSAWVGYKVWPKLGFDGKIPIYVEHNLPPEYQDYRKISDFYRTSEGVSWWEEHGEDFDAEFDMAEGSHSIHILEGYIAKKAEKDGKAPSDWIKSALIRIAMHLKQSEEAPHTLQEFLKENSRVRVTNPDSGNRVMLPSLKHTDKGKQLLDKLYQQWLKSKNPSDTEPVEETLTPEMEKKKRHESYKGLDVNLLRSDPISKLNRINQYLKNPIEMEDIYDMIGLHHIISTSKEKPSIMVREYGEGIRLSISHPYVEDMDRTLYVDDGKVIIANENLTMHKNAPKGLGTKLLAAQVKHAVNNGVSKITCWAASPEDGDDKYVGYKVWPKLGYDGEVPFDPFYMSDLEGSAPFLDCKNISDILQKPGGSEWWDKNGTGFNASFDLSEGSVSRKILTEYIAKKAEKDKKTPEEWVKSAMAKIASRLKQSDTDYQRFLKENEHKTVKNPETGNDVKLVSLSHTDKGQDLLSKMFQEWLKTNAESEDSEDSVYNRVSVEVQREDRYNEVMPILSEIAGHPLSKDHLMNMVGADYLIKNHFDSRMKILVRPLMGDDTIEIHVLNHKHIKDMCRSIYVDADGAFVIINDSLILHESAPKGLGTKLLANQVSQAKKHKVERIDCTAARDATNYYIGYKVWPKLGFDGDVPDTSKIPSKILKTLKKTSEDEIKISDLYQIEGGQKWWEEYGDSFDAQFDLLPGSMSEKILSEYVKKKAEKENLTPDEWIKTAMASTKTPPTKTPKPTDPKKKAEEIPWDDIDHDVLDQVWKDLRTNKKP